MAEDYKYDEKRKKKDAALFIRRMRDFHRFSKFRYSILSKAREEQTVMRKGRKSSYKSKRWRCQECKHLYRRESVEVDHIREMGQTIRLGSFNWKTADSLQKFCTKYLEIFLDPKNHQVLCKSCHRMKTFKMEKLWKNIEGN